jgi:membrane associated rhomboid family serine protease
MKNYLVKQLLNSVFYPLLFMFIAWVVFIIERLNEFNFSAYGILPRKLSGITGIITSVFIHGDIQHVFSNTLPILVLGTMLFYFYKKIAKATFIWIWLVSGVWLWIGGRNSDVNLIYHIGASTLIYGLATFLFFSGVFRNHLRLMVVSALVVFLYGSIMWGIFPLKSEISWEGHLFGALAGVLVAYNYRKEGPQRQVYYWGEEEEDNEEIDKLSENFDEDLMDEVQELKKDNEIRINFIYKEKNQETK